MGEDSYVGSTIGRGSGCWKSAPRQRQVATLRPGARTTYSVPPTELVTPAVSWNGTRWVPSECGKMVAPDLTRRPAVQRALSEHRAGAQSGAVHVPHEGSQRCESDSRSATSVPSAPPRTC